MRNTNIELLDKLTEIEVKFYVLQYLLEDYLVELNQKACYSRDTKESSLAMFKIKQIEKHFENILKLCKN